MYAFSACETWNCTVVLGRLPGAKKMAGVIEVHEQDGYTWSMAFKTLEPKSGLPSRKIYTVIELTREISGLLEARFPLVWVEGEISNCRTPSSGHLYFSLKDANAQIRAVMFRYQNQSLSFRPTDGLHVVGLGRITVYEPRGEYQIVFESLELKGRGALQLAFEELKRRLDREGLFDRERKKPLPLLPRRVVVVTSPTGAAIRDFLKVLHRRYPNMEVLIYPVRVQGVEAGREISAALDHINREIEADVIVVTRGGGSLEDLWPFNTEEVARAVYRSNLPVLSAVGHEIDFTITDFVADRRAPTPSAAAEILVPPKEELEATVSNLKGMLKRRAEFHFQMRMERLRGLQRGLKDPRRMIEVWSQRIDEIGARLKLHWQNSILKRQDRVQALQDGLNARALQQRCKALKDRVVACRRELGLLMIRKLDRFRHDVSHAEKGLESLDPSAPLKRGYSLTRLLPHCELVTGYDDANPGDLVQVVLARGHLVCHVEQSNAEQIDVSEREIKHSDQEEQS